MGKHLPGGKNLADKTIKEIMRERNNSSRFNNIRKHSRIITSKRIQKCYNCGYDKHVETCHIKNISKFPLDTKISIVNHPDNLILLCPNCHWEFDNGKTLNIKINGREEEN